MQAGEDVGNNTTPRWGSRAGRLDDALPVHFEATSLVVRGETYAHADRAVVAAGEYRLNNRFSIVIYAGIGARATRRCVENLPTRGEPTEALPMRVGSSTKSLHASAPAAMP